MQIIRLEPLLYSFLVQNGNKKSYDPDFLKKTNLSLCEKIPTNSLKRIFRKDLNTRIPTIFSHNHFYHLQN
ncbi:hypothetical protein LEP1GSC016_2745 [Leptospira borgpetersenii serovar Hardjo-bovis str. Sponselee]|uniref:Uncharacterized protein n=1 Tax=Leptospira borgpetersenii serovar Hardjo-bovis str. Sponselee TaxID=1303729 RepID=M6BEH4_LEPBO|nr:hypothetical protein LBK6_01135 [Leptospira borgpetersenii serovar Hardjo]AWV68972.1 hypothetical protein B9T54_01250 [Leptospira borgpetersenii serovar Hardjo-bovis]EMJ77914.1 hypothetical protein LEP1GSC016_2745 [Leptospira borgpetersenii serovar Hardjo-bovis str. Sponselee]TQE50907.1 hypothetical protein FFZ95_16620 [Leptospira borgpetersenii]AMX60278.1 hypothetical protein LBK9_01135 [Leptospira borgpetersenii serovar Hardjo]